MSGRIISQNHTQGIPLLTKNVPSFDVTLFVASTKSELSPLPLNLLGNPGDWGEFKPTAEYFLISPGRKIPFNRLLTSSATKSVVPSPPNSNFLVITLCNLHL